MTAPTGTLAAGVADVKPAARARVPVALVDYGASNMVSVGEALTAAGADVRLATRPKALAGAALVVVPGVGASGPAMRALRRHSLDVAIRAAIDDGATFLGICLGMQLMFERSEEDGAVGLGLLAGTVQPLPDAPRVPHIGWNQVQLTRPHPLTAGLDDGTPCYFVHSFAAVPADQTSVIAVTEHGGTFASAVASGRLLGVQFHPERSGSAGLRLLANAVELAARRRSRD